MKKIILCIIVLMSIYSFIACGNSANSSDNSFLESYDLTSQEINEVSVSNIEKSDMEYSDEQVFRELTYEEFCCDFSYFQGEWKVQEMCDSAKIDLTDNYNYIVENGIGSTLNITEFGIDFLEDKYLLSSNMPSGVSLYTKSEICRYMGYLDYEKIPLPNSQTKHEFIELWVTVDSFDITAGEIACFYLCEIDINTMLFGIDGIFFTADRVFNNS